MSEGSIRWLYGELDLEDPARKSMSDWDRFDLDFRDDFRIRKNQEKWEKRDPDLVDVVLN
jgi:hypothetical protein